MLSFVQDIRYTLRLFRKTRGITFVSLLALAMGIGANCAVYTVVNAVLIRPLPYKNPENIIMVWETNPQRNQNEVSVSYPNFKDWQEQSQGFESLAASVYQSFNITGRTGPDRLHGLRVTSNLLPLLGANITVGRSFLPDEEQPGKNEVVIVSHNLWQVRFGGQPDLLNSTVTLNDVPYTVVGILPPEFQYPPVWPTGADIFVPLTPNTERRNRSLTVVGRPKPGVTLARLQTEMTTIAENLQAHYADTNKDRGVRLIPIQEQVVGGIRTTLVIFLCAAGFVLLIGCANIANLLLARASSRQKEIAIRLAMGASRWRLIRQLLTESVVLALCGGVLGMLFLTFGITLLVSLLPEDIPRIKGVSVDGRVLAFAVLVSILTGLIFGLIPALQSSKPDLNEVLKDSSRGTTSGTGRRYVRSLLVVAQVAMTVVLLTGAALMIQSFVRLQDVDPGLNPNKVLTMWLSLPKPHYAQPDQQTAFFQQALERVKSLPGVKAAGLINALPLGGRNENISFTVPGREASAQETPVAGFRPASPGYFDAMGIPLIRGRVFEDRDSKIAPGVVMINQTMARKIWPDEDPIGKSLIVAPEKTPREIVGIVGDTKHRGLDMDYFPEMYLPYVQRPVDSLHLVVRTSSDPVDMVSSIRGTIWTVDKDIPIAQVKSMSQIASESVAPKRFYTFLLSAFAVIALTLAIAGVYGTISYTVSERTHEIGVRVALGAQPNNILSVIIGQGMRLVIVGEVFGIAAAFGLTRIIQSFLYGTGTTDLKTFIGVPLLLAIVGLLACYLPARTATRVDPAIALRHD
jgi:putative ABC transport system permease protein